MRPHITLPSLGLLVLTLVSGCSGSSSQDATPLGVDPADGGPPTPAPGRDGGAPDVAVPPVPVGNVETLDTTFGTQGIAKLAQQPTSMSVDPDGKIVLCNSGRVQRVTAKGEIDTTFGSGSAHDVLASCQVVHRLADGRYVAVDGYNGTTMLTSSGAIDTSYGTNGEVDVPLGSKIAKATQAVFAADGSFTVAGNATYNADGFFAKQYGADGLAVSSFG
jgi:hypothetical protein